MYLGLAHTYVLEFGIIVFSSLRMEFNCRDNRMKLGTIYLISNDLLGLS